MSDHVLDKPQSDAARRARAYRGRLGFDADGDDNNAEYYQRATVTLGNMEFQNEGEFRLFARIWRLSKRRGLETIAPSTVGR